MPSTSAHAPDLRWRRRLRLLLLNAAVAGVYVGLAALALLLAGPPGYASPLFPSAGWALAAVLVWRARVLPAVALASALVNIGIGLLTGRSGSAVWLMPLAIGLGAAAQAALGAALVRRYVARPVVLNVGRDVLLFALAGATVACLISPSVATAVLLAQGVVPVAGAWANWLTWYLGDALGVLIAAPLALAFVARPRADWRPRRITLGLPLLGALALVASAMLVLRQSNEQRLTIAFERDAERLARSIDDRLSEPLHLLQAVHSAARLQPALDADGLREVARWWFALPHRPQAVGLSLWVPLAALTAFEAEARRSGDTEFRVFDRDDGRARAADGAVLAIRHITPSEGNRSALGVNTLSIPAARQAVLATRRTGVPAASAGFRLTQASGDDTGIVLYQALYDGSPGDELARETGFRGVVFVTLNMARLLADLQAEAGDLRWCLVDPAPGTQRPRLAGAAGCEASAARDTQLAREQRLLLGGRPLLLRVSAERVAADGVFGGGWLLAAAGLASTTLLGALLLIVTGQTRRTGLAVQSATGELRQRIQERGAAEAALRDSEQRLRVIVDQAPVGVIFVGPSGRLLQCNPRLADMVGRPAQSLIGSSVADLVVRADLPAIQTQRRELLDGRALTSSLPVRLARDDGSELPVRVIASALRDEQGRVLRMVGVIEDISEHLQLEASERSLRAAEAASQAKSEFLSRMSHELRTPLNAMIGFAQLLEMRGPQADTAQQHEWLRQIQQSGWHLLALINETLDLSRVESGAAALDPKDLLLQAEVQAALSMLATSAARHEVTVATAIDPALAVRADATRLRQILANLLSNAIKYNRRGGTVSIDARPGDDATVTVRVTDTGLGLSESQLARLFEPYNRLGRESSGIEGTGIGLVISRRLAEAMGGTLQAESRAGSGATFTLTLPAASLPVQRPTPAQTAMEAPVATARRHVHYVEDNPTNVEIMRGLFGQRPQYQLTTSTLGLDGLAAIRHQRPDLVLLDRHLPDIDGLHLLQHLKDDDDLAAIPVILVSADANPASMQRSLTLGARSYVTKPIEVRPFLELLDATLTELETRW